MTHPTNDARPEEAGAVTLQHAGLAIASAVDLIECNAPGVAREVLIGFLRELGRMDPDLVPRGRMPKLAWEVSRPAPGEQAARVPSTPRAALPADDTSNTPT